ncbi:DUF1559 family PulG-like putative transporter [Paludisphaera soli]|uniref:DUF1559 family PulG-like putative transporter n=1 Tax=Paludisphaera soli TaxID=2712865 RepID=UPI0013EA3660|nr:DUF1559 domain-containing protein [Paludisphaera soli]
MRSRAGLTLVEVLTLTAVLGFLLLFVVPMIQSARSGHGPTCQRNLQNLALAINNYAIQKHVFPPSTTGGPAGGLAHAWTALILNDLDQFDLAHSYNFEVASYAPANRQVVGTFLRLQVCPDNPQSPLTWNPSERVRRADGSSYSAGVEYARGDYAANWGGGRLAGFGDHFAATRGNYRGVMTPIGFPSPRGVARPIGPDDVADGLGTTILLGEKRASQGWAVGGYAGSEFDVSLSPQSPDRPGVRTVVSGSYHRGGGVNFAFADGSARYISGTIDREVWYALITRDGGETVGADSY